MLLSSRKKESPIRGRKGGFVSRQSEAPAERMAAYRQIPIICAELVEGANRGTENLRKAEFSGARPAEAGC
ncbi:hypothetical protein EAI98_13450 [Alistipes finegoldii]|nr:hypothetical protein EAI98_13450 [Alistipes finegoldii]